MNPLLFANAMPDPEHLRVWLSVAMYLILSAGGVVGLLVGIRMLRSSPDLPQPLKVSEQHDFTPLPMHNKLARDVTQLGEMVETRFRDAAAASSASREKIYTEMRAQGKQLAGVQESARVTTVQVNRLDGKIDRILERMPRHQS